MEDEVYVVYFSAGQYDGYDETIVFATTKKSTATKYVTRFNKIHKKWRKYYRQFEEEDGHWIKDEYSKAHYSRWYMLYDINGCSYYTTKQR